MRIQTAIAITAAGLSAYGQSCCPQTPAGYPCVTEYPGIATNAITYYWRTVPADQWIFQTHVSQYVEFQNWTWAGRSYEVQYKRSLSDTQWLAFTRVTSPTNGVLTTWAPIYPCESSMFFRVTWSNNGPMTRTEGERWCVVPGLTPWK